ncbi:MAG: YeeE/YedE family protein [Granulosicoccus sp.]
MLPSTVTEFTPFASLIGGVLIGLSALLVLLLFGRIAGISGITTGAFLTPSKDWLWRVAFLSGLVLAPLFMTWLGQDQWGLAFLSTLPVSLNIAGMALAGLAVGIGTVLGSGCTSGHGVCGLGRLSGRSLVAVIIFMTTAAVTVAVLRHIA